MPLVGDDVAAPTGNAVPSDAVEVVTLGSTTTDVGKHAAWIRAGADGATGERGESVGGGSAVSTASRETPPRIHWAAPVFVGIAVGAATLDAFVAAPELAIAVGLVSLPAVAVERTKALRRRTERRR